MQEIKAYQKKRNLTKVFIDEMKPPRKDCPTNKRKYKNSVEKWNIDLIDVSD